MLIVLVAPAPRRGDGFGAERPTEPMQVTGRQTERRPRQALFEGQEMPPEFAG